MRSARPKVLHAIAGRSLLNHVLEAVSQAGSTMTAVVVGVGADAVAAEAKRILPTARQVNWLLLVALLSLGEALYLRYQAIEYAPVSLACQAGLDTWLCATFRLTIWLYNHSVFGWVALGAALLNLMRPSILLVAVALAACAFGLVLHNANLAGLAAALLMLSLAPPAPATE